MSFWQNIKVFMGFEEGESMAQETGSLPDVAAITKEAANGNFTKPRTEAYLKTKKASLIDFQALQKKTPGKTQDISSFGTELVLTEPRTHEDSVLLSGYLKEGKPVIVNLKYLDAASGKRLIDFVCGTVYAFEGHMQKLGSNIFLFTPSNIGIVNKQHDEFEFNQMANEPQSMYTPVNTVQSDMFYQSVG